MHWKTIWLCIIKIVTSSSNHTDPCNSYDCSRIVNSVCITLSNKAICKCDTNFVHHFMNNGVYKAAGSNDVFEKTEDVQCVPQLPCTVTSCATDKKKSCVTEDVIGIPTPFRQCHTEYDDPTDHDRKIEAVKSAGVEQSPTVGLTWGNSNECSDDELCSIMVILVWTVYFYGHYQLIGKTIYHLFV